MTSCLWTSIDLSLLAASCANLSASSVTSLALPDCSAPWDLAVVTKRFSSASRHSSNWLYNLCKSSWLLPESKLSPPAGLKMKQGLISVPKKSFPKPLCKGAFYKYVWILPIRIARMYVLNLLEFQIIVRIVVVEEVFFQLLFQLGFASGLMDLILPLVQVLTSDSLNFRNLMANIEFVT